MPKKWLVYLPDFEEVLPQVFRDYEEAKEYAEELQDALIVPFPGPEEEYEEKEEDPGEGEEGLPDLWGDFGPGESDDDGGP